MDHASLISAVESRLNRTDLTALIPDFIKRAEDTIFARLAQSPVRPMGTLTTSLSIAANQSTVAVPSDFIDVISLSASNGTDSWTLVRIDPSDDDYYATRALGYGQSYDSSRIAQYSILGSNITLADPTPYGLSLELKYWQRPQPLVTAENWLALRHANVYEFGTLAHAYKHLRDDEAANLNMTLFLGSLDDALASYPERQNPSERRSDMPVRAAWSILNG